MVIPGELRRYYEALIKSGMDEMSAHRLLDDIIEAVRELEVRGIQEDEQHRLLIHEWLGGNGRKWNQAIKSE